MKEFISIPKNMFEMLSKKKKDNNITLTNTKINNKRKKEDLTRAWKTLLPPPPAHSIPLNQTHDIYHNRINLDNRNNNRNNKPPHTSFTDRLILHFKGEVMVFGDSFCRTVRGTCLSLILLELFFPPWRRSS